MWDWLRTPLRGWQKVVTIVMLIVVVLFLLFVAVVVYGLFEGQYP